uniref:Uncharacterized protein n=1 Tax=Anguilla anguilla TaxID=7936 RepID=A0A0E9VXS7_ANGAN
MTQCSVLLHSKVSKFVFFSLQRYFSCLFPFIPFFHIQTNVSLFSSQK